MKKTKWLLALCVAAALTACGNQAETKTAASGTEAPKESVQAGEAGGSSQTSYPEKNVQFIIPYAAGGGTDSLMRLLTAAMEKDWGKPVVVANKAYVEKTY